MDPVLPSLRRNAVPLLAAYAVAGSLLSLLGWFVGVERLADWDGDGIAQVPNNAIAVAAMGAALLLARAGKRRIAIGAAALGGTLGFATLLEHLMGLSFGIDGLLLTRTWSSTASAATVAPGRMGLPSSMSLTILGLAFALRFVHGSQRAAAIGGVATVAIAMLSLIGYTFGADTLFAVPRFTAIASQTSSMLLALGLALLGFAPDVSPMPLIAADAPVAQFVRRALPAILFLPIVLGWLIMRGESSRLYDAAFGTAMLVLAIIAVLTTLLLISAAAIHRREREVRESSRKFETLFEQAAFPATLATLPDGRLVDANRAFVELFGYSREEVIGRRSAELGISASAAHDVEATVRTKSGDERIVVSNSVPVEIGGTPHLLTTVQDITARKAAEDALRKSTEALVAADRMKDEFLATLSHELRTPLTAIVGWSQLLLGAQLDEREQRTAIEAIRASAKAQAQLVEDVLDVSRVVTGKLRLDLEESELKAVIDAAVATVRPAAEAKRMSITTTIDPTIPRLLIDPDRMQQVIWNLLSNSIKFSPAGTPIDVVVRREPSGVAIDVTDRGPGIDRDFLPHVFERFRQADSSVSRSYSGLGLGLALAKDLVQLHGGTIAATSEKGHGATFTIHLPVAEFEPAAPARAAFPSAVSALAGLRVLYVDDRDDARLVIGMMLERSGAHVVHASSVDEAVVALSDRSPHVVVTDLAMPKRDGYELLQIIRADARWHRIPVLALTAQARNDDEARAIRAGFDDFLRKPIESERLVAAVTRAVARTAD